MTDQSQYRVHPDDPRRVVMLWTDPLGRRWWADPYSADNYTDDEVKDWARLVPAPEETKTR